MLPAHSRIPTPGTYFWPAPDMDAWTLLAMLGPHASLLRLRALACPLARHVESLIGSACLDNGPRAVFWCRMAGHLSEAPWGNAVKTARLETQAAQLFPLWGPSEWTSFRQACLLLRAEHFLSLGSVERAPWLYDRVFLRLAGLSGLLPLPPTHAPHLASLAGALAAQGRPGFSSWLCSQGIPWTPDLLGALISIARFGALHSVHSAYPNDTLVQEVLWAIDALGAQSLSPNALDVASCWIALRPDLAQRLLDAGASMPYPQNPLDELEKVWASVPGFNRYAPESSRASARAHALSSWESSLLAGNCSAPSAFSSPQPTRL